MPKSTAFLKKKEEKKKKRNRQILLKFLCLCEKLRKAKTILTKTKLRTDTSRFHHLLQVTVTET